MAKVILSRDTFEYLVKHLEHIRNTKNDIIDQYFPEPSDSRDELKQLISDYIKRIDTLIKNVNGIENTLNGLNFVTIGSTATVEDLDEHQIYEFHIISPLENRTKSNDVSYISPVGKALLLKQIGDIVTVKAPAGVFRYKIKSIDLTV